MSNYRIRAYTEKGLEVMKVPFDQKPDQDAYWSKLLATDGSGLAVFGRIGYVILSKEYMTQGGNWETEMVTPVEVKE